MQIAIHAYHKAPEHYTLHYSVLGSQECVFVTEITPRAARTVRTTRFHFANIVFIVLTGTLGQAGSAMYSCTETKLLPLKSRLLLLLQHTRDCPAHGRSRNRAPLHGTQP